MLETITKHTDLDIKLETKDFGGIAIDNHGEPLPDDTLRSCKEADAILLGKWGRSNGPRMVEGSGMEAAQGGVSVRCRSSMEWALRELL